MASSYFGGSYFGQYYTRDLIHYVLSADAGSFVVTGASASLLKGAKISAESGAVVVAGSNATLVVTPVVAPVAVGGGFYVRPRKLVHRVMVAEAGAFVSDAYATLLYGRYLSAGEGRVSVAGVDVALRADRVLIARQGTVRARFAQAQVAAHRQMRVDVGHLQFDVAPVKMTSQLPFATYAARVAASDDEWLLLYEDAA